MAGKNMIIPLDLSQRMKMRKRTTVFTCLTAGNVIPEQIDNSGAEFLIL